MPVIFTFERVRQEKFGSEASLSYRRPYIIVIITTTISLFLRYCKGQEISCTRISPADTRRTCRLISSTKGSPALLDAGKGAVDCLLRHCPHLPGLFLIVLDPFPLSLSCFQARKPILIWVRSCVLYNSLSDVYAILGPGQSWLPQVLCSPPSFFPDPKSWALPEWTVPICVRDEEFQCKHVLSSVILMGLSCYQKTVSKIMLCLNMAKMNQMVSNSPSLA